MSTPLDGGCMPRSVEPLAVATVGVLLWLVAATGPATAVAAGDTVDRRPRREDHGALVVLDVYGTYEEMGRQQVALLGDEARAVRDLYADRWSGLVRSQGVLGRFVDAIVFPVWTGFGRWREDSGFYDEAAGMARALGAAGAADGMRLLYGGVFGGGSTVFAATRGATVDGRALIGRNVDWSDDGGRRRPVVTRYHPVNGDLPHLTASWPLVIVPIVGVNAAGLAISINFFDADVMMGLGFPRLLYRRVLQRARTVEEALALLADDGNRGGAGMLVLADAEGALALAECTAKHCAALRPGEDWLAHSNHARTPEMRAHDEGRTADSDRRLAAMEAAVRGRLGAIDPGAAAAILRDRSNTAFINDSTVANLRVLNAVVVDPRARLVWHGTTQQPLAPFGAFLPLAVDGDAPGAAAPIAADPRLAGPVLAREREVVAGMRQALRLFEGGRVGDAGAIWDRFAGEPATGLEPHRLAWARARVRWATGRLADADTLLATADDDGAPFEVRAYARVARGLVADRRGARADALRWYRAADAYLAAHPAYDAPLLIEPLRRAIRTGLAAPATAMPAMPDLQNIPR
ncbi:MAG: hypothetical protein IT293_16890 [Deltaproteobacteria bacterium]|nr:hypothetical protein [Deltaproteobacteria bacterium]